MTAPVAAAYMGISTSTFLTRFRSIGIKEGGNTLWSRAQLDRIIASQFALPQLAPIGGTERDTSWDNVA
jgi:hypothetical protein